MFSTIHGCLYEEQLQANEPGRSSLEFPVLVAHPGGEVQAFWAGVVGGDVASWRKIKDDKDTPKPT